MRLVPMALLLSEAEKGNYAVGAFNASNMEIVQAIAESAEEEGAPVIVQATPGAIRYAGLDYLVALVLTAARKKEYPVALHLDHGNELKLIKRCIDSGFSSVMFDGSNLSLEKNIALTQQVVTMASSGGASVEAELGRVGGTEDDIAVDERQAMMTDPGEAKHFAEETGVDALAVAVGTSHGPYRGTPALDFPRLEQIREKVRLPLVLHGASGVPDEAIQCAIKLGVRKINIDTDIRQAFFKGAGEVWQSCDEPIDPRKILAAAREEVKKVIRAKIRLFGSSGSVGNRCNA